MIKGYRTFTSKLTLALVLGFFATTLSAAPVTYKIDSSHTYPSFEADHMGLSVWRGKVNSSSGSVVLDKEAGAGSVEVTMDMSTIDFGHDKMTEKSMGAEMLNVAEFPTATYVGTLTDFVDGQPTAVEGNLTLLGVTKPVKLEINEFTCIFHPRRKVDACGADASGNFNRDDFGLDYAKQSGFDMGVKMLISIETYATK